MKFGKYFCGNEISEYGRKYGFVDYAALAKSFQHVLCNEALKIGEIDDWSLFNGSEIDEDGEYTEVYQYYIISGPGAQILRDHTDEIVWYNDVLDLYVWGVTHWGTAWSHVLTDIECEKEGE